MFFPWENLSCWPASGIPIPLRAVTNRICFRSWRSTTGHIQPREDTASIHLEITPLADLLQAAIVRGWNCGGECPLVPRVMSRGHRSQVLVLTSTRTWSKQPLCSATRPAGIYDRVRHSHAATDYVITRFCSNIRVPLQAFPVYWVVSSVVRWPEPSGWW